jgi:membrane protein DedA with SNARE-associated domain
VIGLLQWFGTLADSVLTLGLVGVYLALLIEGLGLPFPGDAALAFYGFAAAEGRFHLGAVWLFGTLGYITGALIVYGLSLRYGAAWLDRFANVPLFNARSMMRTTRLIDRYGPLLLVPGRFLPGVRSVSSYVAGLTRMDFRMFLIYTGIGVTLWCFAWIGLGYWFGDHMKVVIQLIQSWLTYATGAVLLIGGSIWMYRRKYAR